MSRSARRAGAAAFAILLAVMGTSVSPAGAQSDPSTTTTTAPSGTTGAPDTPSGDPAIDDLVGCVQGSQQLLVLFLIDESASLKQSDPDNRRVDAARSALDSLVALSSSEGAASPKVDVALAAFSNEYRLVKDWTPAGPDTAKNLNASLDEFADFNKGIDTDFVNALSSGREALADQAAVVAEDGGAAPCRAVMLFTDGGFDLAVRANKKDEERLGTTKPYAPGIELTSPSAVLKAEAAGRQALCKPGGLADDLRSDDITLLTVALSGGVARRSQLPLAAASAGKADTYTCGTQPKAGTSISAPGAYLPAADIDVLVTQFNGVGTRLAGGSLVSGADQVKICGQDPCAAGSRTFTLDASLRRAQILALPPKEGAAVVIKGPSGETATITEAGKASVGATALVARSIAGRGFVIDLTRGSDSAGWNGKWTASITDPSGKQEGDKATLQIYVFSDIGVEFAAPQPIVRGETWKVAVALSLPTGVKAADVIETAEAEVRLHNPVTDVIDVITLTGPPGGPFTGSYEPPASLTSNAMEASAQVKIGTSGSATFVSQSATTELLVKRPGGSIQFAPGSLKMPSITGKGSSTTGLVLVGGSDAGCVWFGSTKVPKPPEGAAPVEVTLADGKALPTEGNCVKVAKAEAVTIDVVATPANRTSGVVSGTIQVFEKVDGGKRSTTQVPFRFDTARGVDEAQRLLLSLLLLVLGLGLPLVALIILNAVAARFQDLDAIQGTALPVRVKDRTIWRVDGSYPRALSLRSEDFGSLATAGNNRRFTFGGVEFRARASRNPFGATVAMAAPAGRAEKLKGKAGSRVELDPALAGSWVFLLDSDKTRLASGGEVEGLLIAFVAEGDISAQTRRMLPDVADRLPQTAGTLAGLVRRKKVKGSKKRTAASVDEPTDDVDPDPDDPPPVAEPDDPTPVAEPAAAPAPEDGPDDEPGGPPLGFTGVRPDA